MHLIAPRFLPEPHPLADPAGPGPWWLVLALAALAAALLWFAMRRPRPERRLR